MRSATRSAMDSFVLQNGKVSCGGRHARVSTVVVLAGTVLA